MIERVLTMRAYHLADDRHEFVWRLGDDLEQRTTGTLAECERVVRASRASYLATPRESV